MAYVHRVVKAGPCVEHKKMQSFRVHTKGVKRGPNVGHTTAKQERINEKAAEERLRWKINANFGHRDLHAVLHYYDKGRTFEQCINDGGTLYRVVPPEGVLPQEHQPPHGEGMLAVYRPIDETHAGTEEDPIPWVYGMDCTDGLYYSYNAAVYLCKADMKPCVWAPGTAGVWQWEAVT